MSRKPDLLPQRSFDKGYSWTFHHRESLAAEAGLACQIIERWALVAVIPDGEDSAGRQKLRLPTAQELAERACDLAAASYTEFEQRGWVHEIPSPEDAEKAWKEKYPKDRPNGD